MDGAARAVGAFVQSGRVPRCKALPVTERTPAQLTQCKCWQSSSSRQAAPSWQDQQWRRARRRSCRRQLAPLSAASSSSLAASGSQLVTFEEVQEIARARGLEISVKTLGPFYRIVCRDATPAATGRDASSRRSGGHGGSSTLERAAEEAGAGVGGTGRVLAVTSGFVVPPPLGLMHCDTLQVFTRGERGEEGARTRGGVLGLGLLMGAATFAFGAAAGCRKAEILAINDDDAWHDRLVGYYSRFGFQPVRVVRGDSLADLPHMLVWGGAGTRMDADVLGMLRRWAPAVRRNSPARATTTATPAGGAPRGSALAASPVPEAAGRAAAAAAPAVSQEENN